MPTKPSHGGRRPGAGAPIRHLKLTVGEAMLIVDALNGTIIDPPELARQLIPLEIADAIRLDHLDKKWQVDGPDLVTRLSKMSDATTRDLLVSVEKWWKLDHAKTDRERTRRAGLTK